VLAVKPNTDGGLRTNLKGRLNFSTLGTAPSHIITLSDSNFQKTAATASNRPTNDSDDAYIGYDQGDGAPAHIGISLGAPKSLSNYIGNIGDGANWKERLTASLKEFKTDVTITGKLTLTGTCTGCSSSVLDAAPAIMTAAVAGRSKLGFDVNGRLSVSENGQAVAEVAKKTPQQFTYTVLEPFRWMTQRSTIFVNRTSQLRLKEVFCQVDTGRAVIHLTNGSGSLLSADIDCTTTGTASVMFVGGNDIVRPGQQLQQAVLSTTQDTTGMLLVISYMTE
jgi:hypothetical protein